tara:strand:+ start:515 stop:1783 length:1269 start_codon:yes stop_codon:yes gene_type:complete
MMRYVSFILIFAIFAFHACEDNKNEDKFVIEFSPALEHDFGTVEINESASTKVRIKNSDESSGPFTGTIEIEDSPAFFSSFTGILELQKNESKEVYITFTPSAGDNYSGKLVVKNDKNFNEFYLSGVGASPVSFSISPISLDFGLVEAGSTKDLDLTFENNVSSGFDLELSLDLSLSDFTIGSQTNFTLSPGSNKTIAVRYTPTQNVSTKALEVSHNSSIRANPESVVLRGIKDISSELVSGNIEGWNLFKNKDYASSVSKFQETVAKSLVNAVYDSLGDEAVLGRGWARLFERSTNDYASSAFNDFVSVYGSGLISTSSEIDALAGISVSGVLIVSNNIDHYNAIVEAATILLANYQSYQFQYNTNVDHKDVRYALVQTYFNLSNYSDAAKQLDILDPVNAPHSSTAEDILVAIQALAGQL